MTKNYFEQESGRSMVEMLGVLAIIGVLSVGGISGYTTAMNKHKANEILNAAAVRAMAVSAQIQSGVDPSTATGSVTTEPVGSAEIGSASPVGTEQFKLVFTSNIDGPICDQMKNIAGENSVVGVACNRLLYNNDMSPGVEGKNPNKNQDGSCKNGFTKASDCEDCPTGYGVNASGACEACTAGQIVKSGVCTSCSENQMIQNGACVACPTGTGTNTTAYKGEQVNSTGCYCKNDGEAWEGTLADGQCKSAQKVFKVLRNGTHDEYYTHSEAQADCAELGAGWGLASGADIDCGYNDNCKSTLLTGLTYTSEADAWNSEFVWLSDCCEWDTSGTACSNTTADGSPVTCPSGDSGTAWYVYTLGSVGDLDRGDLNFALCVQDS